ncbi:MAG: hypothetical protein DRN15_03750 [Thermoprotei archaeon]|nr:MAG: hypothetical protein DRM97_06385 [Thermoprotei archaeon]RLF24239.1 MAG: hypothetical protein DRN15_03750 [Thermoprotei archaeon]
MAFKDRVLTPTSNRLKRGGAVFTSRPVIVGHRANTIRTLMKYLRVGVPMIEVDVRKRRGELIVLHGPLSYQPVSVLGKLFKKLMYIILSGDPVVGKMPLERVLRILNGKAGVWLDIKEKRIEDEIIKLLKKTKFKGPVVVSSTYHTVVKKFKEKMPEALCAISLSEEPVDLLQLVKSAKADIVALEYLYANEEIVETLHGNDVRVAVWTVNDPSMAKKLANIGVDYIITDDPYTVMEILKGRRLYHRTIPRYLAMCAI